MSAESLLLQMADQGLCFLPFRGGNVKSLHKLQNKINGALQAKNSTQTQKNKVPFPVGVLNPTH